MAVDPQTTVSAIEGIGPAREEALRRIGVYTVFDLLRATTQQLASALGSLGSVAEIQTWKNMASLLQVDAVTPQWAEALVRKGIQTEEELFGKSVSQIAAVMNDARAEGLIPTVPDTEQIAAMLKDVAVLLYSGCLTGTVRDEDQNPIPNVTVKIGPVGTETDVRGRFRLLRIPLGASLPLRLSHADYQSRLIERPRVVRDLALIDVYTFRLVKRTAAGTPVSRLSELDGDVVPIPPGQPVRQTMVEVAELESGDVLLVRLLYDTAPDAQLVSRFKTFEDGVVLVRTVRVPLARLPGAVRIGDHFRFANGTFDRADMSPSELHRLKVVRRLQKEFAQRPVPQTPAEEAARREEQLHYLLRRGFFATRRTD